MSFRKPQALAPSLSWTAVHGFDEADGQRCFFLDVWDEDGRAAHARVLVPAAPPDADPEAARELVRQALADEAARLVLDPPGPAFDAALDDPGAALATLTSSVRSLRRVLALWSLASGAPTPLAHLSPTPARLRERLAALEGRGIPMGEYDDAGPVWWLQDEAKLVAWDGAGEAFRAGDELLVRGGRRVPRGDIARAVAFVEDDGFWFGVRVDLAGGDALVLLDGSAPAAEWGPMVYDRFDSMMDTGWCSILSRRLAAWASVPCVDGT